MANTLMWELRSTKVLDFFKMYALTLQARWQNEAVARHLSAPNCLKISAADLKSAMRDSKSILHFLLHVH